MKNGGWSGFMGGPSPPQIFIQASLLIPITSSCERIPWGGGTPHPIRHGRKFHGVGDPPINPQKPCKLLWFLIIVLQTECKTQGFLMITFKHLVNYNAFWLSSPITLWITKGFHGGYPPPWKDEVICWGSQFPQRPTTSWKTPISVY